MSQIHMLLGLIPPRVVGPDPLGVVGLHNVPRSWDTHSSFKPQIVNGTLQSLKVI